THATKNRANVSGSGKKPWKQKGTGRARVGSVRNPLWRHGGTVFGPEPRSYDFKLSRKVERGALRAALTQKMKDGEVIVVDALTAGEAKTKAAAELLERLGVTGAARTRIRSSTPWSSCSGRRSRASGRPSRTARSSGRGVSRAADRTGRKPM